MVSAESILLAIRCLQRLGAGPAGRGASAAEVARDECAELGAVTGVLARLREAGLVEAAEGGRYRLARPAAAIRVADVWSAVGRASGPGGPAVTIADLLDWEARAFDADSVARAA